MPVDSEAIERDLCSYGDQWKNLQEAETESAYGPVSPETADKEELSRKGSCIHDVTLRRGMDFPPPFSYNMGGYAPYAISVITYIILNI